MMNHHQPQTVSYVFERSRQQRDAARGRLPSQLFDKLCPTFRPLCYSPGVAATTAAFNTVESHGLLLALATSSNNMYILSTMRPPHPSPGSAPSEKVVSAASSWSPLASLKQPADDSAVLVHSSYHNLHKNWITDVSWVPGDTELLSCSEDGTVSLIDVVTSRKKASHEMPSSGIATQTRGVCSVRAEAQLCVFGANDAVRLWDRRANSSQSLKGHARTVTQCEVTDDGLWLLSSSLDGTVKLWDRRKGACLCSLIENREQDKAVASVRFNRSESQLLLSSETNRLLMIDWLALTRTHIPRATSGASTGVFQLDLSTLPSYHMKTFTGHVNRNYLKKASFSADEHFIICGSDNGTAMIWSVHSGAVVEQLRAPTGAHPAGQLTTAIFSPVASATVPVVCTTSDRNFTIWCEGSSATASTNGTTIISAQNGTGNTATANANGNSSAASFERPVELERLEAEYTNRLDMSILEDFEIIEAGNNDGEDEEDDGAEFGTEPGVCTYTRGYTDQHVFVCLTCTPPPADDVAVERVTSGVAGICYECAQCCHEDHEVTSIGKRKHFRCDCGTGAIAIVPCALQSEKSANTENTYSIAFRLRYCFCKQPDDGQLMVQCTRCCEWYHHHCIGIPNEEDLETVNMDFLCETCLAQHYSFLRSYPSTVAGGGVTGGDAQLPVLGRNVNRGRFLPIEWRAQLTVAHVQQLPEDEVEEIGAEGATNTAGATTAAATPTSSSSPTPTSVAVTVPVRQSNTANASTIVSSTPVLTAAPPTTDTAVVSTASASAVAPQPRSSTEFVMPISAAETTEDQADLDEQIKAAVMNNDRATAARLLMRQLIGTVVSSVKDSRRTNVTGEDITRAMTSLEERRRRNPPAAPVAQSSPTPAPAVPQTGSHSTLAVVGNKNATQKRELPRDENAETEEGSAQKKAREETADAASCDREDEHSNGELSSVEDPDDS